MLLGGDRLTNWVIETATPEQLRFLNRHKWTVEYDRHSRLTYLFIDVENDKDATLANIYFG